MTRPFRIAVVNSHPIQYFAPLYAFLNRDPSLEITGLYCSDFSLRGGTDAGFRRPVTWDVDLLAGYEVKWLGKRARNRTPGGFWSLVCPEVWREIRQGNYDAVLLHGYAYAAYVLAFLAAKSRRIPVAVRSETHLGLHRTGLRRRMRDSLLSRVYRHVDGFLAIGSANREYYRSLGVPERRLFDVPYTVDNERFIASSVLSSQQRAQVRHDLGLAPDLPVVVYASKLMPRKHPDDLVKAMARLQLEGVRGSLLLVGTGEMDAELRSLVANTGMTDVVFAGFVNQARLPAVLGASDVFVLPSENEPWGLIVNEAMCAALPVVVTDEVGCAKDLVGDGDNGRIVRCGDPAELAEALRPLLLDAVLRRGLGERSRDRIRAWGYGQCRDGLLAFSAACGAR